MTRVDSKSLKAHCTAQKLFTINDFLVYAFAKKAKQSKKRKEAKVVRNELILVYNQRNSLEVRNLLQLWPDNIQMFFSL